MKILISPAKSLDFDSNIGSLECTQPVFLNKTSQINSVLKEKSPKDLMQLQGISQKLSDLNWKRNNDLLDKIKDFKIIIINLDLVRVISHYLMRYLFYFRLFLLLMNNPLAFLVVYKLYLLNL